MAAAAAKTITLAPAEVAGLTAGASCVTLHSAQLIVFKKDDGALRVAPNVCLRACASAW